MRDFRSLIVKIGFSNTVILITVFSVVASVFISLIMMFFLGGEITLFTVLISAIVPVIIAPVVSWFLIKILFYIHFLEEKMRALATFDTLTGAMTRHALIEAYENAYFYAQRNALSLALIYIDMDDFKSINDSHGHAGGDEVLISISEIIHHQKRKSDVFGRMGGEEFVLVLPNTSMEGATLLADKLLHFARNTIVKLEVENIQYTISIGVSVFNLENVVSPENLIKQADKALYQAKIRGKNCVAKYKN